MAKIGNGNKKNTPSSFSGTGATGGNTGTTPPSSQSIAGTPLAGIVGAPSVRPASRTDAILPSTSGQSGFTEPKASATYEKIAEAAYFRWLQFGGSPEENWLEAERSLRAGATGKPDNEDGGLRPMRS